MFSLTIDGHDVMVPEGTTVIQAAEQLGIFIPRYCYHPGLSIAGNCRICLVEVETLSKLQIACNTLVAEGMVVHTQSDKAQESRRAVLEFLLANHPLDCPVCDQSGECDLQNYYMDFGRYDPRFREHKVKKRKAVQLGPHVMLDQERCILCSRCVRFTDEITKTGEFGIFNRGDRAELGLYPGDVLDNPYSANVVDICPVGALTESDFRFKARVWYLSSAPTICNGCSQGCNVDLHYLLDRPHLNEGARIVRVKPRFNPEVNQWWMCDAGRYGFGWVDRQRLTNVRRPRGVKSPMRIPQASNAQVPQDTKSDRRPPQQLRAASDLPATDPPATDSPAWEEALMEIAALLSELQRAGHGRRIGVIASAQLTTEELFLIRELFQHTLGAAVTASVPEALGPSDEFLIKADKNPNTLGATMLGLSGEGATDAATILDDALEGKIDVLWVFQYDLVKLFGEEKVGQATDKVSQFIYSGTSENPTVPLADWVLPSAAYVEKDGTFVNCHGRVQRIGRAFPPLGEAREDWRVLLEVARLLQRPLEWRGPEEIFRALTESVPEFQGLNYDVIGTQGAAVGEG